MLAGRREFERHDGRMTAVTIGGEQFRLFAGQRPDGTLSEIAVSWGKHGSSPAGLLDSYATALSLGLGHGVPLDELLRPGLGLRFAPHGSTSDPDIPWAYSAVDYCCRRLAIDWLRYPQRAALGVLTPAERGLQAPSRSYAGTAHLPADPALTARRARGRDGSALPQHGPATRAIPVP